MRIEIENLTIQNFLSFGNIPQTLNFNHGINLIKGTVIGKDCSNGAGKSSVCGAFSWVLYGKVPREVNQSDLMNWKNRRDCKVEINFKKGSNKYKVLRGLKPNFFEIYENDILLPAHGKREYQDFISWDIIGLHYNTFINLIYSNINSSIAILKMTKPQKRYFIEKLFNLEIFTKLNDNCSAKLRNIESRITDMSNARRHARELIHELEQDNKTLNTKLGELSSSNSKLELLQKQLKELNADEVINTLSAAEIELSNCTTEKTKIKKIYYSTTNRIKSLERTISVLESVISEKRVLKMEKLSDQDICPLCNQKIKTEESQLKVQAEIEKQKKNSERCVLYAKIIEKRLKPIPESYHNVLTESENMIEKLTSYIESLKIKLEDIIELKQAEAILLNTIEQEDKLKNEFSSSIQKNSEKITALSSKITDIEAELRRIESLKDCLSYIKENCKDEKIKYYAISSIIPFLNKNTNTYLAEVGFSFYLEIDKFIDAKVKGPGIYSNSYNGLSRGEARSIDIAFQMALHDISRLKAANFIDVLFCDEILDSSIDSVNIAKIFNIVKNKQIKDRLKVFVISHRNEIEDLEFNNVYTIAKSGGYSKIT